MGGVGGTSAGGVVGGLMTGNPANAGLVNTTARGAAEGGIWGFSEGRGGLGNRLGNAGAGAMLGAGGALAVPALSRAYSGAKNIVTGNTMNKAQRMLMRDLASDGYEFGKGVPKTSAPLPNS